jgi:putative SOS response-associated peptidase YedK
MCGRYATTQTSASLNRAFELDLVNLDYANSGGELEPDYNMAPTKTAPIIVGRRDPQSADAPLRREAHGARWGLIPSWAKDPSIGNRMINARMETLLDKPSYKGAFAKRRAIVPADGYYEWYTSPSPTGAKPIKQPFFIRPKDGTPLAMAGLYEWWKDTSAGQWVLSFTVITTSAEDSLGHIHERMPLLLEPDAYSAWLDPTSASGADLLDLLIPAAPGRLDAVPVSTAVNNVRNNGPDLIKPLATE